MPRLAITQTLLVLATTVKTTFCALTRLLGAHPVASTFSASLVALLAALIAILFNASDGVVKRDMFHDIGDADGIYFLGHIYQTNLDARSVTISWLVGGCGKYMIADADAYHPTQYCGPPNVPIDVYIDSSSAANFSYDPSLHPKQPDGSPIFIQSLNQFSTTHMVTIRGAAGAMARRYYNQEFFYPFDTYQTTTSFVAVTPANASAVLPILHLLVVDAVDSFLPATDERSVTGALDGAPVAARVATITIGRTEVARAFTLVLFAVNWALALVVLYLTVVAAVSPARHAVGEGILFVPLTVILTVPALRALFVDAPRFGMLLDILGLFAQMALVSLCSILFTVRVSLNAIAAHRRETKDNSAQP
ncbi:hypothetical protein B0H10DRAFT_1112874 [Mycena sp. CBHHK59/15]|nr:hypothetical protein B0H10DRAFT_1112874 [Mycena sp. CBHHK59/15]